MKRLIFLITLSLSFTTLTAQWSHLNGPFNGHHNNLRSVTIDATNIFIGTDTSGVWRTNDDGKTWTPYNLGFNYNVGTGINPYKMSINGNILFLGTEKGVFKTDVSVCSWTICNNGLDTTAAIKPKSHYITAFAFNGTRVFIGTMNGVYTSTDNGGTWTLVNNGLGNLYVNCLYFESGKLYAGTYGGLYVSSDNGVNWTLLYYSSNSTSSNIVNAIIIINNKIVLAISPLTTPYNNLVISTDNGANWTSYNTNFGEIKSFYKNGTKLYATQTLTGLSMSNNDGVTWSNVFNSVGSVQSNALNSKFGDKVVLASIWSTGGSDRRNVSLSTNGGDFFSLINDDIIDNDVHQFGFMDNNIIVSSATKMSLNNGEAWTEVPNNVRGRVVAIKGKIFMGGGSNNANPSLDYSNSVWMSVDTGKTFTNISTGITSNIYSIAARDTVLFAGTTSGIYKSTNYGATWTSISTIPKVRWFLFRDSEIYVSTASQSTISTSKSEMFKSSDDGLTWSKVFYNTQDAKYINALAKINSTIYVAGSEGLVLRKSVDFGATWSQVNFPLNNRINVLLACDTGLFVADPYPAGLFFSSNEGLTWQNLGVGLDVTNIYRIAINGNDLYCGTDKGLWKRKLPNAIVNPTDTVVVTPIDSITGFFENKGKAEMINIYPNPSNGVIAFEFKNNIEFKNLTIMILNQSGQLIYKTKVSQQNQIVDLTYLKAKGTCVVQIIDEQNKKIEVKKIIIN